MFKVGQQMSPWLSVSNALKRWSISTLIPWFRKIYHDIPQYNYLYKITSLSLVEKWLKELYQQVGFRIRIRKIQVNKLRILQKHFMKKRVCENLSLLL